MKNLKRENYRSQNGHGQNHVKYGLERGKDEGWVFCSLPMADGAHVDNNQHIEDIKHILAITEGQFGKPVTRSGRFINANYPPEDATKEELEAIKRFWGDPDDVKPLSESELNRYRSRLSRKRKPPDFTSLTLPPKVVRDAWFGSDTKEKAGTKRRNINPLYPPPDMTKEEWEELEAEWGDAKDFQDDITERSLSATAKKRQT
jgi:hypothetical protein